MVQSVEELQNFKIEDIAQGRELVEEINNRMQQLLRDMQNLTDNAAWKKLNDEGYELKKARHLIRNQMTKIVKERRNVG